MPNSQHDVDHPDHLPVDAIAEYPLDAGTFDEGEPPLAQIHAQRTGEDFHHEDPPLEPDDLRTNDSGTSAFDPLSPEFKLGLTEDQVLHRPNAMPGIEAPAYSVSLSHDEQMADHQDNLNALRDSVSDPKQLVYEFGPFAKMVSNMEKGVQEFSSDEISDLVMNKVRRMVHEACLSKPMPDETASDEKRLAWKKQVLEVLVDIEGKEMGEFLQPIDAMGHDVTDFHRVIRGHLASELADVEMSTKNLVSPTLGQKLFSKLLSFGRQPTTPEGSQLVGDLRRFRNEEISGALNSIKGATEQITRNASNSLWMKEEGPRHIERIAKLKEDLVGLTKGIEHQVDMNQISRTLKSAGDELTQAKERVEDPAMQQRLKELVTSLVQAVERMVNRAAQWLKRGGKAEEAAPAASPARPSFKPA